MCDTSLRERQPRWGRGAWSRRQFLQTINGAVTGALAASFLPHGAQRLQAHSTNGEQPRQRDVATPHDVATSQNDQWQRRVRAYQLRIHAAERHLQQPALSPTTNGDEERYSTYIASFSKTLPHTFQGEVESKAYVALLTALQGQGDYNRIPLGGAMHLANPQAALAYQLEGHDSHALTLAPPPTFDSLEIAGELVELYWHALTRDVPFADYGQEATTAAALADLQQFPYFQGWQPHQLFRGESFGDQIGPYLSQFLLLPIPYGATTIEQRYHVPLAGDDHMMEYTSWLGCQNGVRPSNRNRLDPQARYLRNGRDLGEYVHQDFTYQSYLNAALLLNSYGKAALSNANPYKANGNQNGFATFGAADVLSLVAQVANLALKAAWVQKWLVHRRLRPEVFAARLHHTWSGAITYPIHAQLEKAQGPQASFAHHGNYLLPQAYPEGCPTHPAYPAGHAVIAGACVTILKAFFDETFVIPNPQVSDRHGLQLMPYRDAVELTVGNELNKLAANITLGRDMAGVHWRSDGIQGLLLGEAVALGLLQEIVFTYPEAGSGFQLTRFDGIPVVIRGDE